MVLELEFFFYGESRFLNGKRISYGELVRQIQFVEGIYDREHDNFLELMCRCFDWNEIKTYAELPDYTYDRDTEKLIRHSK
ncbi:MAG: hypothetical protein IJL87_09365 [Clostridia bacterium]|nr:hypothetical protein [Clostridia bacterium]